MFLVEQGEWFLVSIHSTNVFFSRSLESNIEAVDEKEEKENIRNLHSRKRRESLSEDQKKTFIKEVTESEKVAYHSMHWF